MTNDRDWNTRLAAYQAQIREANAHPDRQQTVGKEVWNIVFTK